jgi:phosphoribosylamine--glycine ligase
LLRAFSKEQQKHELLVVGGNPGIWELATQVGSDELDGAAIAAVAVEQNVDLVVVGPEAPLAAGVTDALKQEAPGVPVFAPTKAAAQLEASKSFAKSVMEAAAVPTASAVKATSAAELNSALDEYESRLPGEQFVVKADGLAAGKGVIVTADKAEAQAHGDAVFETGGFVILEDYLSGPEFSLFFICDGKTAVPLAPAQDFKRIFDGDTGPNTGGMGAYTGLDWLPASGVNSTDWCTTNIAQPVLDEMNRRGTPFMGVLFAGLVLTPSGVQVIEFNARFGDPETQVVLEKLQSPLSELLLAAATGSLANYESGNPLKWDDNYYCNVVLASAGYPETSHKGDVITGIPAAQAKGGVVLQAGTAYAESDIGALVTNGGRVLSLVAKAPNLDEARKKAYNLVELVTFPGRQFRTDIALKAAEGRI